jgi:hypothetical protein
MNKRLFSMALIVAALSLAAAPRHASGPFGLKWSTIDGGGGTSTGGVFRVRATIGQPDAGPVASGGPFTVTGGFWSFVSVVQTPGAPILKIQLLAGNQAVISWPVSVQGFTLEYTEAVGSGIWQSEQEPVVDTASEHTVTVPTKGIRIYRLKK